VFISPRLRATTKISHKTAESIVIEPALNEIPFDLKQYCTERDFSDHGSILVRKVFLHLFSTNKLLKEHEVL